MKQQPLPRSIRVLAGVVFASIALTACGSDGAVVVEEPWARPTAPTATNAAFYGIVENESQANDQLIAMASPQCATIELHRSSMIDGVMSMRLADPTDSEVLTGQSLTLEPGGLHLMCLGLQEPFVEGQSVELELAFRNAGTLVVNVPIENR